MKAIVVYFRPVLLFFFSLVLTVSCEKNFEYTPQRGQEPTNYENPTASPVLKYSNGALKSAQGDIITSGDAISVNSNYLSSFWLELISGIARGDWEISNDLGEIIFQESNTNGIDVRLDPGNYYLRVEGTHEGESFLYNNIEITSSDGSTPIEEEDPPVEEDPIRSLTSPVSLSNLSVTSSEVSVRITISKEEYYSQSDWFHLYKVNGNDFKTKQAVSQTADSISFTITTSKTNNALVEFNAAYSNGSVGGVWMTASASESIMYSEEIGENFFSYRIRIVGSEVELRTADLSTVLISTDNSITAPTIPGENGDETVRWTALEHFIKTEVENPIILYRIGEGYSWTVVELTPSASAGYWEFTLPDETGTVYFQWGSGTSTSNFVPASSEMEQSDYYVVDEEICAKNI